MREPELVHCGLYPGACGPASSPPEKLVESPRVAVGADGNAPLVVCREGASPRGVVEVDHHAPNNAGQNAWKPLASH